MNKLEFHTEMIKMYKDEIQRMAGLLVYMLIGIGAGLIANHNIQINTASKVGIAVGFGAFAIYYTLRTVTCWRGMRFSARYLADNDLISEEEIRGVRLSGVSLGAFFVVILLIPLSASLMVALLILING